MAAAAVIAIVAFALFLLLVADGGEAVKERVDAVECSKCGRPTWSASGLCTVCRRPERSPPNAPPTDRNPMEEPEPRMPALDADGNIAEDVHCRRCGYNLRGINPMGVCPECEMPGARSLFGDRLRFSDPQWVRRLDNGVRLLLGAIFATIGATVLGIVAMIIFLGGGPGAMPPRTVTAVLTAVMTLVAFVWVAAVWMITTPDPGGAESEKPINARTLARWFILASLAAVPLGAVQQQGFAMPAPGAMPAMTLLDSLLLLMSTALGLIAIVGTAAGIVYLRSLALRIPHDGIALHTKIAGWGYVVVTAAGQVNGIVMMLALGGMVAAGGFSPWMGVFIFANCAIMIGAVVFGIWMIVVLIRYAAEFRKAREGAERFAAAAVGLGGPLRAG